MKATLEFNLPEEKYEFDMAINAGSYHSVLFELQYNFKKKQENYLDFKEETTEKEYALLEKIMGDIAELMETHDIKTF
jgi:hypothetical protein